MTTFSCKSCNAPVTLVNGGLVKTCACHAPVVANMTAVARGAGGVK